MNNKERIGHITSSKIHLICANGRSKSPITGNTWSSGALTYFEEKRIERKLGRCLDVGGFSRPANWGTFLEEVVFNVKDKNDNYQFGINVKLESKDSTEHPDPEFSSVWSGSADLIVENVKIGEIKCYQLKKFAQYTDALTIPTTKDFTIKDKIENLKSKFPQEYWQMVSNAIINQVDKAEAISYAPYESEMQGIKELALNYEGKDQWNYRFIAEEDIENLAVLKDGGYYQNLNTFEFTVPKEDKEFLIERMRLAKNEILLNKSIVTNK